MGVKVSDLLEETTHVELQVGGATVGLEARVFPKQVEPDDWERIVKLPAAEFYAEVLGRQLAGWDLLDAKGEALPVTTRAIKQAKLPVKFLEMVHRVIGEAHAAGKGSASSSPAGSAPTAS